jgi:3-dehydroquinate dehydratase-2
MKKVLIIHGPNINLIGQREPEMYGSISIADINRNIEEKAKSLGMEVKIVQSNHEGEIVTTIQQAMNWADCIIINPAAYTHTSVAIRDAIEVHLSNIYKREDFRQKSFIAPVTVGQISGFGDQGYYLALEAANGLKGK